MVFITNMFHLSKNYSVFILIYISFVFLVFGFGFWFVSFVFGINRIYTARSRCNFALNFCSIVSTSGATTARIKENKERIMEGVRREKRVVGGEYYERYESIELQ